MKHKSQENAVFIAIHPPTYRSGGFLAHGVLNLCATHFNLFNFDLYLYALETDMLNIFAISFTVYPALQYL